MLTQKVFNRGSYVPWGQLEIYMCIFACQNHRRITFNDWAEKRETKHPVTLGTVPNKEELSLPKCQQRPQREHSNPSFAVG